MAAAGMGDTAKGRLPERAPTSIERMRACDQQCLLLCSAHQLVGMQRVAGRSAAVAATSHAPAALGATALCRRCALRVCGRVKGVLRCVRDLICRFAGQWPGAGALRGSPDPVGLASVPTRANSRPWARHPCFPFHLRPCTAPCRPNLHGGGRCPPGGAGDEGQDRHAS